MTDNRRINDKILASLTCSAAGDAIGAVTENLTFNQIREKYNGGVREFIAPDKTAFAYGNKPGEITDDFSQTYLLAKEIVKNHGEITTECAENMLVEWSNIPHWFNRFAGPTTRQAIKRIRAKNLNEILPASNEVIDYARQATNGAAMKISPAGLFHPCDEDKAIEDAIKISMVTHDNQLSLAGACATAASIAYGFRPDANLYGLVEAGLRGAEKGKAYGLQHAHIVGGPDVAERIHLAMLIALDTGTKEERLRKIYNWVGTGLHISEAVPAAFGIILICNGDPIETVLESVNIGYDTDTVAAIAGSIIGAYSGMNDELKHYTEVINAANGIQIDELAAQIAGLV